MEHPTPNISRRTALATLGAAGLSATGMLLMQSPIVSREVQAMSVAEQVYGDSSPACCQSLTCMAAIYALPAEKGRVWASGEIAQEGDWFEYEGFVWKPLHTPHTLEAMPDFSTAYRVGRDRRQLWLEDFGWSESSSPQQNAQAVEHACLIARRGAYNAIAFGPGTFQAEQLVVDVDRRGFSFYGAGVDASIIKSVTSEESFLWQRIDPRNRSRDRLHDFGHASGFTVDGQSVASRTVFMSNYGYVGYKAVNHADTEIDLVGQVSCFDGWVLGADHPTAYTRIGLALNNNAITFGDNAYVNNGASRTKPDAVGLQIDDGAVALTAATLAGASVIAVPAEHSFKRYQRIEIGAGSATDVRYVMDVSGTSVTLDLPMNFPHAAGSAVKRPVVSINLSKGTIETGAVYIRNAIGLTYAGIYHEEADIRITGRVENLTMKGNHSAERNPSIFLTHLHPRSSSIVIEDNHCMFEIHLNVPDRSGNVNAVLDPMQFPRLRIRNNYRVYNAIVLNGHYKLQDLEVERCYNYNVRDLYGIRFRTTGYYARAEANPAGGYHDVIAFLAMGTANRSEGFAGDITAYVKRISGSHSRHTGILKRAVRATTFSGTLSTETKPICTVYPQGIDEPAGNIVDIRAGGVASANQVDIRVQGENISLATEFLIDLDLHFLN